MLEGKLEQASYGSETVGSDLAEAVLETNKFIG